MSTVAHSLHVTREIRNFTQILRTSKKSFKNFSKTLKRKHKFSHENLSSCERKLGFVSICQVIIRDVLTRCFNFCFADI